jgi:hypothetical protein
MFQDRLASPTPMRLRRWLLIGLVTCLAAILLVGFTARQPTTHFV